MVRRHTTALRVSMMAGDLLVATALFVIVSVMRYGSDWESDWLRLGVASLAGRHGLWRRAGSDWC